MGGSLQIDSQPEVGTTVTIRLLAEVAEETTAETAAVT
jgi:signal transduction histidine kinase